MRILPIASLLFMMATPVMAQQPSLEQQLDTMSARVTGTMSTLHDTVITLKNSNDQLTTEVKTLTTDRDDLRSKVDALTKKVTELNGNIQTLQQHPKDETQKNETQKEVKPHRPHEDTPKP